MCTVDGQHLAFHPAPASPAEFVIFFTIQGSIQLAWPMSTPPPIEVLEQHKVSEGTVRARACEVLCYTYGAERSSAGSTPGRAGDSPTIGVYAMFV